MKSKTNPLIKKYPFIPAYSDVMGSFQYWTDQQLEMANEMKAPENTYMIKDGKYYTIDDIKNADFLSYLKEKAVKYQISIKIN